MIVFFSRQYDPRVHYYSIWVLNLDFTVLLSPLKYIITYTSHVVVCPKGWGLALQICFCAFLRLATCSSVYLIRCIVCVCACACACASACVCVCVCVCTCACAVCVCVLHLYTS